ncbi:hypothetical protein ABWK46_14640, partial [Peribacillus frigoritolerans]|uniref:hypothetical protein n=1 Tax=Peribacillus frigoritolerans TaxID=450367 RepID=UPI0033929B24
MSGTAPKTEYFFIIKRFIEFLLNNDELKTQKLNYHSLLIPWESCLFSDTQKNHPESTGWSLSSFKLHFVLPNNE